MAILTSLANYKYSLNTIVIDKTNTPALKIIKAIAENTHLRMPCLFFGAGADNDGRKLMLSLLKDLEIRLNKKIICIYIDGFFQSNFSRNSFQEYDAFLFSHLEHIVYRKYQQDFIQLIRNLSDRGKIVLMFHSGELNDIKFMQDAMLYDYTNGITVKVL